MSNLIVGPKSNFVTSRTHVVLAAFLSEAAICRGENLEGGKHMPATFRKLVIAIATVVAIAGTTVGSAEARWGWRGGGWGWGWGGFGLGLGTGLLLATATTAILTVMATRLTRTAMAIPTATDIAALTITAATILAIGTRVITPIVGPTTGTDRPTNSRRRNGRA